MFFRPFAIADAIRRQLPAAEILFVGPGVSWKWKKCHRSCRLPHHRDLTLQACKESYYTENLVLFMKILKSLLQARKVVSDFKPDIAVGVGGYASGPLPRCAPGWVCLMCCRNKTVMQA